MLHKVEGLLLLFLIRSIPDARHLISKDLFWNKVCKKGKHGKKCWYYHLNAFPSPYFFFNEVLLGICCALLAVLVLQLTMCLVITSTNSQFIKDLYFLFPIITTVHLPSRDPSPKTTWVYFQKSLGGGESWKPAISKKTANFEFPEGWGSDPLYGEIWQCYILPLDNTLQTFRTKTIGM